MTMLPPAAQQVFFQTAFERQAVELYAKLGLGAAGLPLGVFREGLVGYYNLRGASKRFGTPPVLTLIDFNKSSQQKRLWVINVEKPRCCFTS